MASLYEVVLILHLLGAVAWGGALAFHILMVGPAVKAAGPAGGAVMKTALAQGGFGRYYGIAATVTVLAGAFLFVDGGYDQNAFSTNSGIVLTVAAIAGLLAWLHGVGINLPIENKMKKLAAAMPAQGPPAPEQMAEMQGYAAKMEAGAKRVFGLFIIAVLGMASRTLFL